MIEESPLYRLEDQRGMLIDSHHLFGPVMKVRVEDPASYYIQLKIFYALLLR